VHDKKSVCDTFELNRMDIHGCDVHEKLARRNWRDHISVLWLWQVWWRVLVADRAACPMPRPVLLLVLSAAIVNNATPAAFGAALHLADNATWCCGCFSSFGCCCCCCCFGSFGCCCCCCCCCCGCFGSFGCHGHLRLLLLFSVGGIFACDRGGSGWLRRRVVAIFKHHSRCFGCVFLCESGFSARTQDGEVDQ
jgi:hypothetical protein